MGTVKEVPVGMVMMAKAEARVGVDAKSLAASAAVEVGAGWRL